MIYKTLMYAMTLSHALVAGTFFTFSAFAVTALARTGPESGAKAMQMINVVILRSPFLAVFLLSAVLSFVMPVYAWISQGREAALPVILSAGLYLLGVFGVTMAFNVPLNNKLDAAKPGELNSVWAEYLRLWVRWNHVRTIASVAAMMALVYARWSRS